MPKHKYDVAVEEEIEKAFLDLVKAEKHVDNIIKNNLEEDIRVLMDEFSDAEKSILEYMNKKTIPIQERMYMFQTYIFDLLAYSESCHQAKKELCFKVIQFFLNKCINYPTKYKDQS
ncbi:MAG: hypothetical protein Fur0024_0360 [Patescibacteria group bacterium]